MLVDRRMELFQIEAVIGHRAKDRLAVVAALDDVLRLPGQHESWQSSYPILPGTCKIAAYSVKG